MQRKIENKFGQTSFFLPICHLNKTCSIWFTICSKTPTMVYSIQYTVIFSQGKNSKENFYYIYKYIYNNIYNVCDLK